MPLSGRSLIQRFVARFFYLVFLAAAAAAGMLTPGQARAGEGAPLHSTGDRQLWHRKENIVELFGHAVVSQPGETLTAEYIRLDMNNRILDAKGNCVYVSTGNVIYGDEMHFNLDTRTGTVVGGRVSNERFSLSGQRINKLGDGRFQTHWGEYSTCVDCPTSWSLMAEDVDMQIEGYAFMRNVTTKIGDTPAAWMPYLIVPMKVRRQTGFLFPSFSFNTLNGWQLVLPFFWAINDSADMTFGGGHYTNRGWRAQWEGRYALSDRSVGRANVYYLNDSSFADGLGRPLPSSRWAVDIAQTQELPFNITQKLRLTEVSDNLYPSKVPGDVPGMGELNLASSFSLSYGNDILSSYVAVNRYRTLINTDPDAERAVRQFDPKTVQQYPTAALTFNDRVLLGDYLVGGLTMGFSNFTRSRDAFDINLLDPYRFPNGAPQSTDGLIYEPGVDPIRKASRISIMPTLYTTFRPFDLFSIRPSVTYYYYWYTFPGSSNPIQTNYEPSNLGRSYFLFQTDFFAQLEKIYEYPDDQGNPRTKHLIRPMLTYSVIPEGRFLLKESEDHPFVQQIQYAQAKGFSGYNFDNYDIVPLDTSPESVNYFNPLGNSLTVGARTQLIRRNGSLQASSPSYTTFFEAAAGETFNFRNRGRLYSRFFQTTSVNVGNFTYSYLYYWWPYVNGRKHSLLSSMSYNIERSTHQGIFAFDRSVSLTHNWDQHGVDGPTGTHSMSLGVSYSLSDYFLPMGSLSYDFISHKFQAAGLQLQYQSASRCWKLAFIANYNINQRKADDDSLFNGYSVNIDFALNIAGSGFGGITELANQATATK